MAFVPYTIYAPRLPILKAGFFFSIGGKFHQIVEVRPNRQDVDIAGAYPTEPGLVLNVTTSNLYEVLHGDIALERVVHLMYLALTAATPTVLFRWGTEPLLSKWRAYYIGSNHAGLTNPLTVDRWSYDKEMRIALLKAAGAQTLWLETLEYAAQIWEKEPPKKYLKILANGQAVFVEAG